MIDEENKNIVISNVTEAAAIASDSAVQLVLAKFLTEEEDRRPFLHARLEIIKYYRGGEIQLLMIMKLRSMYILNNLVDKCEISVSNSISSILLIQTYRVAGIYSDTSPDRMSRQ